MMKFSPAKWRIFLPFIALLVVAGCSHPIEIVGEGDVVSASGTRNCSLENFQTASPQCTENRVSGDYIETYSGEPRSGWQFRRWASYCQGALNNECSFNTPGAVVQNFLGQRVPPLKAVFRSTTNTGFTTLVIGHDFLTPVNTGLEAHAGNAGFNDHSTVTITGVGAQGAPLSMWNNASQRATIQAVLNTGGVEVFGMTYDPASPTVDGYRNWVNYALGKNPDTRFFIAVPWGLNAESFSSAAYRANYENTEQQVHALIDSLRAKFPGVDIYAVPYGRAAVELYALYSAGNLPDITAVTGAAGDAIFQDAQGNPGDMLVALSQLVWLGAIYRAQPADFEFDPGYSTDVVALAQAILTGQNRNYRAPPEIDTDTDGDGIVDRLDPDPSDKPNILVIMADDLGINDLAISNNNTQIDTPNMDQLARDGVRFTRHYSSSVCSPARSSFLTGHYPERLGYLPNGRGISPGIETLPERLREQGYTTWHIGKWHIGDLERTAWPDRQGFDHWFGFLNQWRLAGVHVEGQLQLAAPRYDNPWLQGDTEPGRHFTGHLENVLTDKAIEVLSDLHAAQRPWFLNLWFYAPHGPVTPASEFAQNYPNTPAGKYQALVNQLDHNVGRVLAHLETLGAAQDTIIVLVSDNGGTNSSVNSNFPYYGAKATLFEGALRTPLVIKWPNSAMNEQVITEAVGIEDIYPTLMESIGVAPPGNLDGNSFYSTVDLGNPVIPKARFWDHLMTSDWVSYAGISSDLRWRVFQSYPIFGTTPAPVIFDLEVDPSASQAVVPTPPLQLAQMVGDYGVWYRDVHTVDTTFVVNPNGSGVLRGADFLRTPGFSSYTFGMGVPDGYSGPIASQAGIWEMSQSGSTITAQFGNLLLSGDVQNSNSCHSIVVSGYFNLRMGHTAPPESMSLSLYIDGVAVDSSTVQGVLPVPDPTVGTIIGDPQGPSGTALSPPVILNTTFNSTTTLTLSEFSQGLCNTP